MENKPVYRIEDVAAYILVRQPQPCSAQKIQKLCYYTQAWYLARYGTPLFDHDFEAWRSGPVSPALYKYHAGRVDFPASELLKVTFARTLSQEDKSFIDKVLAVYDRYTGLHLRYITQSEDPWKDTREVYTTFKTDDSKISEQCMIEYYSQFLQLNNKNNNAP